MPLRKHADALQAVYRTYHQRRFVHPDPLELLYRYEDPADREVAGLVAALLAYGRVGQILTSVSCVLARLGSSPRETVAAESRAQLRERLAGFRHRFQTEREIAALLVGAGAMIRRHGSLGAAFEAASHRGEETVLPALRRWSGELNDLSGRVCGHLLPDAAKTSACKRLHLYLRWMIRCDEIDPGGWRMDPARLIVPLDTHMHRIGRELGAISRKSAGLASAVELTSALRKLDDADPVRYDFSLTRLGIRPETDVEKWLTARTGRGERRAARGLEHPA
jgi:uncharacterized protein (TIGR02757 family)